jgi:hypothetical protein
MSLCNGVTVTLPTTGEGVCYREADDYMMDQLYSISLPSLRSTEDRTCTRNKRGKRLGTWGQLTTFSLLVKILPYDWITSAEPLTEMSPSTREFVAGSIPMVPEMYTVLFTTMACAH